MALIGASNGFAESEKDPEDPRGLGAIWELTPWDLGPLQW